jgi:cation diffusion facilitator family transporter
MSRNQRLLGFATGSIVIAIVVMALKYLAYLTTGSVALYSDALESIVNLITAAVALWAIWVSNKPADAGHPFGHHKAEYFSAVLEGILIFVAALMILNEAYGAYLQPRTLQTPLVGMAINGVALAINATWSLLLIRLGRRWRSPALVADGWHIVSDVVTSAGVLVGLGLVQLTGWLLLDPLLAAIVAVNILWSGWHVIRESIDSLLDRAVDAHLEATIRGIIKGNAAGALEVHDLRTRGAGQAIFIEFHMVVPSDMTVANAHIICDRIESALTEAIEGARVVVHVEPEGELVSRGVPVL